MLAARNNPQWRRRVSGGGTPLPDGTKAVYLKPAAIGGSNLNTGTSWADAVATLNYAVTLLVNTAGGRNTIIAACPGMAYTDTLSGVIAWQRYYKFYGGFAGTEGFWEQRDVWSNLYKIVHGINGWGTGSGANYLDTIVDGVWSFSCTSSYGMYFSRGGGMIRNSRLQAGVWAALYAHYSTRAENCIFTGAAHGVHSKGAYVNCLFYGCGGSGWSSETQSDFGGPVAVNCIFANNAAAGITFNRAGSDGKLRNCIFWGNGTGGVLNPGGHTITYSYCDSQDGVRPGSGNISSDPLFVGAPNYRLQAGSPCVNAGSNALWPGVFGNPLAPYTLAAMDIDLDWLPRLVGTIDMGCYERQ